AKNLVGGGAVERVRQSLVEPARRPAARQIVDGGVSVLVTGQTLELLDRRPDPADREANLAIEEPGGPRVDARHVPELAVLVQHDGRPLMRRVPQGAADARGGRLEVRTDLAADTPAEGGTVVLHKDRGEL